MDRVHLAAQTEQVDGNNRADFLAALDFQIAIRSGLAVFLDVFLNRGRRDVARCRIDIHEKRLRANARDAASGCKECIRRCNHCIAASDPERHQNGEEGICPGGNPDGIRCVTIRADCLLEGLHLRPEYETLASQNGIDCRPDWLSESAILFS